MTATQKIISACRKARQGKIGIIRFNHNIWIKDGKFVRANIKRGICPISALIIGSRTKKTGAIHDEIVKVAARKLGKSADWVISFIHGIDSDTIDLQHKIKFELTPKVASDAYKAALKVRRILHLK